MKLSEEVEPRLEVVAKEPRLEVREPRLLPDEQDRVLADRLQEEKKKEKSSKIKTTDGTSLTPPHYNQLTTADAPRRWRIHVLMSLNAALPSQASSF